MPSFSLFIFLTFLYLVLRLQYVDTYENRGAKSQKLWKLLTVIYFVSITTFQTISNMSATKEVCGSVQWGSVMLWTIVPNIIIFGSLIAILQNFPGWKAPFANTIGFKLVELFGLENLLDTILRSKVDDDEKAKMTDKDVKELAKAISRVYNDPSMLINEVTPSNWDTWFNNPQTIKLFNPNYRTNEEGGVSDEIKKLYKFVVQRDLISEFTWFILVGSFINGLQINSLANLRCYGPSNKNEEENDEWLAKQKEEAAIPKTKKVYYIKE